MEEVNYVALFYTYSLIHKRVEINVSVGTLSTNVETKSNAIIQNNFYGV
jgi:hypothetical protein